MKILKLLALVGMMTFGGPAGAIDITGIWKTDGADELMSIHIRGDTIALLAVSDEHEWAAAVGRLVDGKYYILENAKFEDLKRRVKLTISTENTIYFYGGTCEKGTDDCTYNTDGLKVIKLY